MYADVKDLYHSSFFGADPESGIGGFGDINNDWEVPNGALADFKVSYPSPHQLWRNYTDHPWAQFGGAEPFPDANGLGNATYNAGEVAKAVNGYKGDFKGFQTFVAQVFGTSLVLTFYSIVCLKGSHSAIHFSVGGCVAYLRAQE